jgi:hypothetical protein
MALVIQMELPITNMFLQNRHTTKHFISTFWTFAEAYSSKIFTRRMGLLALWSWTSPHSPIGNAIFGQVQIPGYKIRHFHLMWLCVTFSHSRNQISRWKGLIYSYCLMSRDASYNRSLTPLLKHWVLREILSCKQTVLFWTSVNRNQVPRPNWSKGSRWHSTASKFCAIGILLWFHVTIAGDVELIHFSWLFLPSSHWHPYKRGGSYSGKYRKCRWPTTNSWRHWSWDLQGTKNYTVDRSASVPSSFTRQVSSSESRTVHFSSIYLCGKRRRSDKTKAYL